MAKVTFDDKVDLTTKDVPEINKITADNINQLKNGVNSNEEDINSLQGASAIYQVSSDAEMLAKYNEVTPNDGSLLIRDDFTPFQYWLWDSTETNKGVYSGRDVLTLATDGESLEGSSDVFSGNQIFDQINEEFVNKSTDNFNTSDKLVTGYQSYKNIAKNLTKEDWVNDSAYNQSDWSLFSGGSIDGNKISIKLGASQSKLIIPSDLETAQKYILLFHIENLEFLHPNVTGLRAYNYAQTLINTVESDKIYAVVFNSYSEGDLQLIVQLDNSSGTPATGTDLVSFNSNFIGCIPWTEEKESYWSEISSNYTSGDFTMKTSAKSVFAEKAEYSTNADSATTANSATTAITATYVENVDLPDNSFNTIDTLISKDKNEYTSSILNWNRTTNSQNVINTVVDGVYKFGGDNLISSSSVLTTGIDILAENYATSDKDYVLILKGSITTTNVDDFLLKIQGGSVNDILQDLTDGVATPFESIINLSYSQGYTGLNRYVFAECSRADAGVDVMSWFADFDVFSLFEKVEGFTIEDYLLASKETLILPKYVPKGTATETFVENSISSAIGNVSKLSPNDFSPIYDIEMLASGGQSLNVGGTASDSSTDFKNSPSFALGSSLYLRSFTTEAEKNAFYGTEFVNIEDNNSNEQYPPSTASLTTVLNLVSNENSVDVNSFGSQIMPFTWGLSGGAVSQMNKGTTPYSDFMECVTKAKEFANKEGKTFGVRGCNWYQGEASFDRLYNSYQTYYNSLSQLFIDINTDVKAITGQTEDVQFFSYQTSPLMNVESNGVTSTDMRIGEAQVQIARDFENVHIAGAMYQFNYSDDAHPSDRAVVGLQTGVAIKRVLYDNEEWNDFVPLSHSIITDGTNFYTHLKFSVPSKPIRFDISGDAWHNPNGKQTNFGFEVVSGEVEKQIAEPFIVKGDTIVLTTSENPVGMTIRYAVNGKYGGGNLCDSQNIVIRNKGIDYVIDNFAVAFSEYVID